MAQQDEEVLGAASPSPSDHKRKHEDLEPGAPKPSQLTDGLNGNSDSESLKKAEGVEEDDSEAKRPRLEDNLGVQATENGYQEEKADETEVDPQPSVESNTPLEDAPQLAEVALEKVKDEELAADDQQDEGMQQHSGESIQLENGQEEPSKGELLGPPEELQEPPENVPQQGDVSSAEQQDTSDGKTVTRKMEVPNTKVGVLIGKAGETIRYLQFNSGARIQITRDAEADPHAGTRSVELIGTLENINKAEKLIKDVIAEADAGGSPSLVARGFCTVQAAGAGEQIQIQVPNEKVGLIIGKGGETIKNLQTRSGARIQLIPQHLPEGDQSKERTVRVTGDKKQIEMAREMIKEVMDQPVRQYPISSGFNQQAFRPRGTAAPQWGPGVPHPAHQTGYDYQQRGPYKSQNPQYAPQAYGNYPPQQLAPRSNFGWERRHPNTMQGPPPHGGYDYHGRQGGNAADVSNDTPAPGPSPAMGPPPSQANNNYGQPQDPDYGQPAPYSQTALPSAQSYGHGYNETKYESQGSIQNPYGGNGAMQQAAYPQGTTQRGYGLQEHYGKPPSYGTPPQGPYAQTYGQPRATQPGYVSYQGPISSTQSYGLPASQHLYPYGSSGQTQQNYPPYGSVPYADGYNHPAPATASAPGYPQQGSQPASGHGQPGGQQAPGYAQYPASQPVYTEQAAANNAVYGYQGTVDPAYIAGPGVAYGAPPSGQPAYSQVPPTQQVYDQSVPQSGGYATVPAGYGKSLSPQPGYPQYDASQMYGAQH